MNFDFKQQPITIKMVIISIIIAVLLGAFVVLLNGSNPIEVYQSLVEGAFGSRFAIASTLRWLTPLLFTAVASAVAFRGGMFNMGVEGQFYFGAMMASIVAVSIDGLPRLVHIGLCFVVSILSGMLIALIPAIMRVYLHASEIVTTLMLNYAVIHFSNYLIKEHFLATDAMVSTIATNEVPEKLRLTALMPPYSVNSGLLIGLFLILLFHILINLSKKGYEIHVTGVNPLFARYGGLSVNKIRIVVMLLSGSVAGLGGAIEIMGVQGRMMSGFSPNFGFDGMLAALMGNSTPVGVLISTSFMGALKAGSLAIERTTSVSRALADIIKGLIISFITVKYLGLGTLINLNKLKNKGNEYSTVDGVNTDGN